MTEEQQSASVPEERPLWKLDRGEQRILLITFVGGVGSIIVGAFFIGIAIALGRALAHHMQPNLVPPSAVGIGFWVSCCVGLVGFAMVFLGSVKGAVVLRGVGWGLIAMCVLAWLLLALAVMGVAIGVH
jgi:hypothetical protein